MPHNKFVFRQRPLCVSSRPFARYYPSGRFRRQTRRWLNKVSKLKSEWLLSSIAVVQIKRIASKFRAASGCGLKESMQHLNSHYRDGGVANEVPDADLLHRSRQIVNVGSLAIDSGQYWPKLATFTDIGSEADIRAITLLT